MVISRLGDFLSPVFGVNDSGLLELLGLVELSMTADFRGLFAFRAVVVEQHFALRYWHLELFRESYVL